MITGLTLATSQHIGEHQDNIKTTGSFGIVVFFFNDPAIHGTPQAISEYSHQPCHFQRWWGIPWDTPMVN